MTMTIQRSAMAMIPLRRLSILPGGPPQRAMVAIAGALALAVAAVGCSGTTETPDGASGMVEARFTSLYGDYFTRCKQCHAPGAPGRTSDIEQTLDFSSHTTAFTTLTTGLATGLVGNHTACNGVAFLATTPGMSLVLAVIDQPTRQVIDLSPQHPSCDVDSISDETVKVGSQPSTAFVTALKTWISNGATDN